MKPFPTRCRSLRIPAACAAGILFTSTAYAQAPGTAWRGSGEVEHVADLQWVKLIRTAQSEFTFVQHANGTVTGRATVKYSLRVDDAKLRSLAAQMNSAGNVGLGMVPGIGSLLGLGASATNIQGMSAQYDGGNAVREGSIRGWLRKGVLHLEWAAQPEAIPYTTYRIQSNREIPIKSSSGAAYSPWMVDATVNRIGRNGWEAHVTRDRAQRRDAKSVRTALWSAYTTNAR